MAEMYVGIDPGGLDLGPDPEELTAEYEPETGGAALPGLRPGRVPAVAGLEAVGAAGFAAAPVPTDDHDERGRLAMTSVLAAEQAAEAESRSLADLQADPATAARLDAEMAAEEGQPVVPAAQAEAAREQARAELESWLEAG